MGGQLRAAGASRQEKMDVDVEPGRPGHVQGTTGSEPQISSGTNRPVGDGARWGRRGQTGQLLTWPRVTRSEAAPLLPDPSFLFERSHKSERLCEPQTEWLINSRELLSKVLEVGKSKTVALAGAGFGENPLPGRRQTPCHCPHIAERGGAILGPLI